MTTLDQRVHNPAAPPHRPNRLLALLRNSWRQLTSMRTALILLFLLAIAAIPGSVLPQRSINIEKVNAYQAAHPDLYPILNRIGAFEVFASPWFSAIYVLLFISMVGCIVPRLREHVRALRAVPPDAPRRLERLPQHAGGERHEGDPATVATRIGRRLKSGRWRAVTREHPDGTWTVSAEKGYLKESGNLLFHTSLIAVLLGVGLGSWYGWHGNRLLVAGADHAFCNTLQQYDESGVGSRVNDADLPPFCLELTDFEATYQDSGQAKSFKAKAKLEIDGQPARAVQFSVNSPLRLDGANVYLLGHGYAPMIRYTDRYGKAQTTVAPFLSRDAMVTSEGVAAFPDVNIDPRTGKRDPNLQVAFEGLYLPTTPDSPPFTRSVFPAERSPGLMLWAYQGNLGMDAGIPGSVYTLDRRQVDSGQLKQVGQGKLLRVGEKWALDDGTTVEFLGTRQYATISVRHDPGELTVLGSVVVLLAGLTLSLAGKRRRVWFRISPAQPGPDFAPESESTTGRSSLVEAGGLPRTDYSGFAEEFTQLVAAVRGGDERPDPAREERSRAGMREGTD